MHIQNSLNRSVVTLLKILHDKLKKFEAEDIIDFNFKGQNLKTIT